MYRWYNGREKGVYNAEKRKIMESATNVDVIRYRDTTVAIRHSTHFAKYLLSLFITVKINYIFRYSHLQENA